MKRTTQVRIEGMNKGKPIPVEVEEKQIGGGTIQVVVEQQVIRHPAIDALNLKTWRRVLDSLKGGKLKDDEVLALNPQLTRALDDAIAGRHVELIRVLNKVSVELRRAGESIIARHKLRSRDRTRHPN